MGNSCQIGNCLVNLPVFSELEVHFMASTAQFRQNTEGRVDFKFYSQQFVGTEFNILFISHKTDLIWKDGQL